VTGEAVMAGEHAPRLPDVIVMLGKRTAFPIASIDSRLCGGNRRA
jgi:hypothetical protein